MAANYYRLCGVMFDSPLSIWHCGARVIIQIGANRPETFDAGSPEVERIYSMEPMPVSQKHYAAALETGRWLDATPSREQS
jgi:hypothetical protein